MLKMLLDPMGGIVLTNDGHAILREIEVAHPAAKSMIELARTQDEEVGDGTTTVIILGTLIANLWQKFLTIYSWRDSGTGTSTIRTKYPPSCHHFGVQKSAGRCSHDCSRNLSSSQHLR
jgi:TCP-1/cpn60 chaperonin family